MKHTLKYWFPLYSYAAIIFYLSGIPKPLPRIEIPYFDKFLHMCEYTVFGFLACRAFKNSPKEVLYKQFKALAILATFMYGISDEIHQFFVSYRACDVFDALADGMGGIIGTFIYGRYHPL